MQIDAIIPARGGSKGLYKKHTVLIGGKPLIEYTIEAAYNASSIRNIYLTTDDSELIKRYGTDKRVKVVERPEALATDDASLKDVFKHVLKVIGRTDLPDILAILLPTTPMRRSHHIDNAVKFARSIRVFDSVASVTRLKSSPIGGMLLDKNKKASPLLKGSYKWYRRQDQPDVYRLNGAIWLIPTKRLGALNNLLLAKNSYCFEMSAEDSVDVDTPYDVMMAEAIQAFRKECFSHERRGGFNIQRLYVKDDPEMGIRRNVFDTAAYERHFQRYRFFLPHIKKSDVVLDMACGSGYGTDILAARAKAVYGIDADRETIRYAARNHKRPNIRFGVDGAESFSSVNRFDKIISVETIEHLKDPVKFLANARNLLKKDGEIWLTCPVVSDKPSRFEENPFHVSSMARAELNALMKKFFKEVNFYILGKDDILLKDTLNNKATYIVARGRISRDSKKGR